MVVASTRGIDAEMVVTANTSTFFLTVASTMEYTSVLLCALTKAYVLRFVILF